MTVSKESLDALFAPKMHTAAQRQENLQKHVYPASLDVPGVAEDVATLELLMLDSPPVPEKPKPMTQKVVNFINAHTAIIDQLLVNPQVTTKELSTLTGYSRGWLSRVLQSDAFQAKLAQRTAAIVDPLIMASIEARLKGLTSMAMEVLEEKLEQTGSADLALSVLALTTKSLGLGVKQPVVAVQNSFVVHVPPKVPVAGDWAKQYGGGMQVVGESTGTVAEQQEEPYPILAKVFGAPEAEVAAAAFTPLGAAVDLAVDVDFAEPSGD